MRKCALYRFKFLIMVLDFVVGFIGVPGDIKFVFFFNKFLNLAVVGYDVI